MLPIFLSMLESPGEKLRFAQLYEANRCRMFVVANEILDDEYLAEDAVNTAFLRLIGRFSKCDGFSCNQMRNYLVIIVRYTSIDMYNKRRDAAEVSFDESWEPQARQESDALRVELDYGEVLEAIDRLPEIYSEALYLSYLLGLSTNEIAGTLNLSASAVKLRMMRARAKLRDELEGAAA